MAPQQRCVTSTDPKSSMSPTASDDDVGGGGGVGGEGEEAALRMAVGLGLGLRRGGDGLLLLPPPPCCFFLLWPAGIGSLVDWLDVTRDPFGVGNSDEVLAGRWIGRSIRELAYRDPTSLCKRGMIRTG